MVTLQQIYLNAASHYETLKLRILERSLVTSADAAFFCQLRVLNKDTLSWAPPPLRSEIDALTDDETRAVGAEKRFGVWDRDWAAGYIFARLTLAPTNSHKPASDPRPCAYCRTW